MNPSDLLKITFTYMPIESGEDAVISSAVSSDPTVADWNAEASTVVAHAIGECEIEFTVLNRDGTDAKCKVKIYVVEAGGSYDDEYKDDTHALRDAFAERMSIINEKLAGLKSSEISLLDAIAALRDIIANTPVVPDPGEDTEPDAGVDPDTGTDDEEGTLPEENTGDFDETEGEDTEEENPAPEPDPNVVLLKQYEERLVEIRLEIAQTESDIAECKAKLARDEAGLAEKYSCVAEDITYDPSADTYPEKADSDFVKVSDYIKDATVDLEYARADNDIGQRVYGFSDAYLRYGTVKKLVSVADMLSGLGYKIVITEAYRPTAAQDRMWELLGLESEAYGGFCKGNALCITLVNVDGTPADDTDGGLTFLLSMQMTDKGFAAGEGEGCFVDTVDYTVVESFLSDVAVFNENTEITE